LLQAFDAPLVETLDPKLAVLVFVSDTHVVSPADLFDFGEEMVDLRDLAQVAAVSQIDPALHVMPFV
jgi:hypothetical protein